MLRWLQVGPAYPKMGGGGGWGAGGDAALRCSPLFALGVVGIPYCGIASGWFPVCVDSPVSTVGWV